MFTRISAHAEIVAISIKTYPVKRSFVYVRAFSAASSSMTITQYRLMRRGCTSALILRQPPSTLSSMMEVNVRPTMASSTLALSSLP